MKVLRCCKYDFKVLLNSSDRDVSAECERALDHRAEVKLRPKPGSEISHFHNSVQQHRPISFFLQLGDELKREHLVTFYTSAQTRKIEEEFANKKTNKKKKHTFLTKKKT